MGLYSTGRSSQGDRGADIRLASPLYLEALLEMKGRGRGSHAASKVTPEIIFDSEINRCEQLISAFHENRDNRGSEPFPYMAELLVLLARPELDKETSKRWSSYIANDADVEEVLGDHLADLAYVFSKAGTFSFSFPVWRFLSQRLQLSDDNLLPALFEQAGLVRIVRDSDKYTSPPNEGADWMGCAHRFCGEAEILNRLFKENADKAIVKTLNDCYIEYRRAYLLIAHPKLGTVLIRNSNYFFGRDKFEHPAYFSPESFTAEQLEKITSIDVDKESLLLPLYSKQLLGKSAGWDSLDSLGRMKALMKCLTAFEDALSKWFFNCAVISQSAKGAATGGMQGFVHLVDHLNVRLQGAAENPKFAAQLPKIVFIDRNLPPWKTFGHLEVLPDNVDVLLKCAESGVKKIDWKGVEVVSFLEDGIRSNLKLALLSGAEGDVPIKIN